MKFQTIEIDDGFIQLLDAEGNRVGRLIVAEDPEFGIGIAGETEQGERNMPVTFVGSNILLGSESVDLPFNGSEDDNIVKIISKKDINGNDVFTLSSVPINLGDHDEVFTDTTDIPITNNYTTVVSGVVTREYQQNSSFGESFLLFENASNKELKVSIGLSIGATVPPDHSTFTIPKKQGVTNGSRLISTHDTFGTDVNIGDDLHLRVKEDGLIGGLIVRGTVRTTSLKVIQTANVRNQVQQSVALNSPFPLPELVAATIYNFEAGSDLTHFLPQASVVYNEDDPVEIEVNNISGVVKFIDTNAPNTIYKSGGTFDQIEVADGESFVFRCISTNVWKVIRSYQYDKTDRILSLGDYSTNAQFDTSPQVALTKVLNYGFTRAKITIGFDTVNEATNRSTIVGIFLNGNLIDQPSEVEQKDNRNRLYQSKTFDAIVSSSPTLEIKYGKGNGGGGSLATVGNIRVYVEKLNL